MLNIALMIGWIVLAASFQEWPVLTIGTVAFAVVLVGLTFYMVLTIKEVRVSQQQANFVDSVTHELKTPIASLRLYLETLQIRELDEDQRNSFYNVMEGELLRLDQLISHLLEVGRLDELGRESEPEDIDVPEFLRQTAETACVRHKVESDEVMEYQLENCVFHGKRLLLETIFSNLLDNAIKYAGTPPKIVVEAFMRGRDRVVVRIIDNGTGIPVNLRKKIFHIFFRVGNELERKQKGTGLGLYIVKTLVGFLKGRIQVREGPQQVGTVFEVDLPGRTVE